MCLLGVYGLMAVHIAHWRISGKSLAPLELNEVMFTLEHGIVTAGFIFLAVALGATLLFGRFFCSWACHILALEDLCAWLLDRLGVRPRPVHSRVLWAVPPLAMLYMFVWPQLRRQWTGQPLPEWKVHQDGDGWASFVTSDFWRNLPGPWIAGLTFATCGFCVVWLLGSRSFCRHICPYGAVFALADRVAPGRIIRTGDCTKCGRCTAACQSSVRVREELDAYGAVLDSACLRDLDCVRVCPVGAIGFGFTRPTLLRSWRQWIRGKAWSLGCWEEVLAAGVGLSAFWAFRGLYRAVPFLLSLALAACVAYLIVLTLRLRSRGEVRLAPWTLRRENRLQPRGYAYLGGVVVVLSITAHSGWIRFQELRGAALRDLHLRARSEGRPDPETLDGALRRLGLAERYGLIVPTGLLEDLAKLWMAKADLGRAEGYYVRLLERQPRQRTWLLELAEVWTQAGRSAQALALIERVLSDQDPGGPPLAAAILIQAYELKATLHTRRSECALAIDCYLYALTLCPDRARTHQLVADSFAACRDYAQAAEHYSRAAALEPSAELNYNAGVMHASGGHYELALVQYRQAALLDGSDAEIQNNLGFTLLELGGTKEAEFALRRALALKPSFAAAHFNLGRLLLTQGLSEAAAEHFLRAQELDPRYHPSSGASAHEQR